MNRKTEVTKSLRAYLLIAILCLSAMTVTGGAMIAAGSTREISEGLSGARVSLSLEDSLRLSVNDDAKIEITAPKGLVNLISVMPAPVSNLYWIVDGFVNLYGG